MWTSLEMGVVAVTAKKALVTRSCSPLEFVSILCDFCWTINESISLLNASNSHPCWLQMALQMHDATKISTCQLHHLDLHGMQGLLRCSVWTRLVRCWHPGLFCDPSWRRAELPFRRLRQQAVTKTRKLRGEKEQNTLLTWLSHLFSRFRF